MKSKTPFTEILNRWASTADLASDCDVNYHTVAMWKTRGSVPPEYDYDLVLAASRRGFKLTYDELRAARVAKKKKTRLSRETQRNEAGRSRILERRPIV